MAHPKDTTAPVPFPCAVWDGDGRAPGSPVVCTCGETIARLSLQTDPWSTTWRTLVFPHNSWVEVNGVWCETQHARRSRQRGWAAKPRHTPYKAAPRAGGPLPTLGPLRYPAAVRCPVCGEYARLDADVLDVVAEIDVWWQAARRVFADNPAAATLFAQERPADVHISHI